MIRKVSEEVDVKASISKAWEVYGSPAKVGMIIQAEMGHLSSVVVLEGDGGVGTVSRSRSIRSITERILDLSQGNEEQ
ncbi:hypothetical protein R6Q57_019633 [Mikania cordata]